MKGEDLSASHCSVAVSQAYLLSEQVDVQASLELILKRLLDVPLIALLPVVN